MLGVPINCLVLKADTPSAGFQTSNGWYWLGKVHCLEDRSNVEPFDVDESLVL